MITDVFPKPNLSNESANWGRAVTDEVRSQSYAIDSAEKTIDSANRSLAGQLNSTVDQVSTLAQQTQQLQANADELSARKSVDISASTVSTSVSTPTSITMYEYTSGTINVIGNVNSPDGARRQGILYVSYSAYNNRPTTHAGNVWPRWIIRQYNSGVNYSNFNIYAKSLANPRNTSAPSLWTEADFIAAGFIGDAVSVDTILSGNVSRISGTATSVNVGVTNITAYIVWGEKA